MNGAPTVQLTFVEYAILVIYFAFVLGIGWALRRYMRTSTGFFLSGRSIPTWVAGLVYSPMPHETEERGLSWY